MNNALYQSTTIINSSTMTTYPIKKVGKGELLGWEDIMGCRNYTSSVKCVSKTGLLYRIEASVLQRCTFKDQNIREHMHQILNERDAVTLKKINHIQNVFKTI